MVGKVVDNDFIRELDSDLPSLLASFSSISVEFERNTIG